MNIHIRLMQQSDIEVFHANFLEQGWEKSTSVLKRFFDEQQEGKRKVIVAEIDGHPAGYATLLPNDPHGPFQNQNIPTINDFNVFEKYQGHGIGTAILDAVEAEAAKMSGSVCLGVGLHPGYGAAQRLYIKRGYVPDGSGIWYRDKPLPQNAPCNNDNDLVLYMSKRL